MPRGASCSRAVASIMDHGCRKETIPNEMLWRHLSLVSLQRKTLHSCSAVRRRETDRARKSTERRCGAGCGAEMKGDCSLRLLLQRLSNFTPPHFFTHATKCKPGAFSAIN